MGQVAAATIAAKRHLSLARVLATSFREYHPDIPFFVILADEVDGYFDPAQEPFELVRLSEVGLPNFPRVLFQYRQQELTYAATPYVLAHLLDRGFGSVCFFKQESLVLGGLTSVLGSVSEHSITLTPHLLAPLAGADRHERELNILQSGVYNVGFLGVSGSATARTFLSWWQDRVYRHCRHRVPQGMHYEQRWLDLVPAFFEDFHVVRDPGFNVGHWNLPERATTVIDHHASPGTPDGSLDLIENAVRQAGIRASLCYEVSDRNGMGGGIRENERFIKKVSKGDGQIAAMMGLHASFTLSDETLETCVGIARDAGVGCHVHVAEDLADREDALQKYGMPTVQRLDKMGASGEKSLFIHCVHIDESEMDLIAATKTGVVHNPESNMNNAVGVTPLLPNPTAGSRPPLAGNPSVTPP